MGKPKTPATPDYAAAAQEQGVANVNAAVASNTLNQVNQVGPDGSLSYAPSVKGWQLDVEATKRTGSPQYTQTDDPNASGGTTLPDGTYVPQFTAITQLSPEQQKLYDQNTALSTSLNDLAGRGLEYVDQATSSPLNSEQFNPLSYGNPNTGNYTTDVGVGNYQTGVETSQFNNGTPTSNFQNSVQSGSMAGPVTSTNLNTRVDVGGDYTTTANGGEIQQGLDYSSVGAMPSSNDFGAQRDQVTAALMERLNPYIQQDREALGSRLANQGINLGSTAYQAATGLQEKNINDQRLAAVIAGSEEQQRLFGNALNLRQQGIGEVNNQGQFANSAQNQGFQQSLANAGLNNQAQDQLFSQGLANANLGNQAQQTYFNQGLANTNIVNQNQQTQFNQDSANAERANANAQELFAQQQANANMQNQNQNNLFAQNAQNLQFNNQAQQAGQADKLANAGLNNSAASTQFQQGLANGQMNNQAVQQAIQQADYFKNQPLNMLNALRSGNQVSMPQFGNVAGGAQIAAAPVYAATNDAALAAQQAYNTQAGIFGDILGGAAKIGGAAIAASDRRLKTNIRENSKLENGLSLYSFEYEGFGGVSHLGYMADEVEKLYPEAVSYDTDGYAIVDYGKVN